MYQAHAVVTGDMSERTNFSIFVRETDNKSENTWQCELSKYMGSDFSNGGKFGQQPEK